MQRTLGKKHHRTLQAMKCLGIAYRDKEILYSSKELLEKAVNERTEILEDHLYTKENVPELEIAVRGITKRFAIAMT